MFPLTLTLSLKGEGIVRANIPGRTRAASPGGGYALPGLEHRSDAGKYKLMNCYYGF